MFYHKAYITSFPFFVSCCLIPHRGESWNHRIIKLEEHQFPTPLLWSGTLFTRPGCPKPHPAWPWRCPGVERLFQCLSTLIVKNYFSAIQSKTSLFQFIIVTPSAASLCPCKKSWNFPEGCPQCFQTSVISLTSGRCAWDQDDYMNPYPAFMNMNDKINYCLFVVKQNRGKTIT